MKNKAFRKVLIVAVAAIVALLSVVGLCACNNNKVTHTRYEVNKAETSVMGQGGLFLVNLLFRAAVDEENTYLDLGSDGKMHFQIRTKAGLFGNINTLLESLSGPPFNMDLSKESIAEMLGSFDIKGGVDGMVEPMFPGFRAKLEKGDLDGALKLIQRSLGFYLYGFDYNNENVKEILEYVGENMKLPSDLLDKIPADTQITLCFDSSYYVKELEGADGTKHKAIYVGDLGNNPYTEPFGVFTVTQTDEGKEVLTLRVEFMNAQVSFIR